MVGTKKGICNILDTITISQATVVSHRSETESRRVRDSRLPAIFSSLTRRIIVVRLAFFLLMHIWWHTSLLAKGRYNGWLAHKKVPPIFWLRRPWTKLQSNPTRRPHKVIYSWTDRPTTVIGGQWVCFLTDTVLGLKRSPVQLLIYKQRCVHAAKTSRTPTAILAKNFLNLNHVNYLIISF